MYIAHEQDIIKTVDDFEKFGRYIDENKPVLTNQNEVLGKKSAYEINEHLYHKKNVSLPKFPFESYPVIKLIFNLVISGKLYVKKADEKGKVFLSQTERKREYENLNVFEKYLFLLETFWSQYDVTELIRWGMGTCPIDSVIERIAKSQPGDVLKKGAFSKRKDCEPVFSYFSEIIHYFDYFGLCTFQPIIDSKKKITKYDDSIKSITPTLFGISISKILTNLKITDWNIPWYKESGFYDKDFFPGLGNPIMLLILQGKKLEEAELALKKRAKQGYIPLYKYIQPVFPPQTLEKTILESKPKIVNGNYTFKVSLGNKIWRNIKVSHNHTLHDLHNTIQEAYNFDNDHLYSFFMDAKRYSRNVYNSPWGDEGPFSDEISIGELELYEGQKLLYLFDYGDSWEFEVQILKIDKDNSRILSPQIIDKKGKAPEQYYYGEEDDDDEDF